MVAFFVLLPVLLPAVFAQESSQKGGQYDITGTWYGANSWGNYMVHTIVRNGAGDFSGLLDSISGLDPLGRSGSTRMTSHGETFRRTGLNTYDYTSIGYYGDYNNMTPWYFGVMYAVVCSGTVVQTGPDELHTAIACKASCNPCWADCPWTPATQCRPGEPWDPFNDPVAGCGGTGTNILRRIPVDKPCTALP